ncbi:hypothetical protein J6590_015233, partial [Homalodisca vitripennis]
MHANNEMKHCFDSNCDRVQGEALKNEEAECRSVFGKRLLTVNSYCFQGDLDMAFNRAPNWPYGGSITGLGLAAICICGGSSIVTAQESCRSHHGREVSMHHCATADGSKHHCATVDARHKLWAITPPKLRRRRTKFTGAFTDFRNAVFIYDQHISAGQTKPRQQCTISSPRGWPELARSALRHPSGMCRIVGTRARAQRPARVKLNNQHGSPRATAIVISSLVFALMLSVPVERTAIWLDGIRGSDLLMDLLFTVQIEQVDSKRT